MFTITAKNVVIQRLHKDHEFRKIANKKLQQQHQQWHAETLTKK